MRKLLHYLFILAFAGVFSLNACDCEDDDSNSLQPLLKTYTNLYIA